MQIILDLIYFLSCCLISTLHSSFAFQINNLPSLFGLHCNVLNNRSCLVKCLFLPKKRANVKCAARKTRCDESQTPRLHHH